MEESGLPPSKSPSRLDKLCCPDLLKRKRQPHSLCHSSQGWETRPVQPGPQQGRRGRGRRARRGKGHQQHQQTGRSRRRRRAEPHHEADKEGNRQGCPLKHPVMEWHTLPLPSESCFFLGGSGLGFSRQRAEALQKKWWPPPPDLQVWIMWIPLGRPTILGWGGWGRGRGGLQFLGTMAMVK